RVGADRARGSDPEADLRQRARGREALARSREQGARGEPGRRPRARGVALRALRRDGGQERGHAGVSRQTRATVPGAMMPDILTEQSGSVLRIELNRPAKKNAMTSGMYATMADVLDRAGKDDRTRVVLWHGAGDSFSAGNDLQDFIKNPPGPG